MMFLTLIVILLTAAYLITCIGLVAGPILVIWDNHAEHKGQGDAVFLGGIFIFIGLLGLLFALSVVTGDINFRDINGDVPTQGCWEVTTTREMVGKTMTDVRHWETIRCP
jgi:hypothetical protein